MGDKMQTVSLKYSDLISLFATANAFLINGKNCYNSKFDNTQVNVISVIIVNYSFAIELYLKLLYAYDFWEKHEKEKSISERENKTQCIKTHCLKILFDNISKENRDVLLKELNNIAIDETSLNLFLERNNTAFEDWRYVFEKDGFETDIIPFKKISETLKNLCEEKMRNYCPNCGWVEAIKPISLVIPLEDVGR